MKEAAILCASGIGDGLLMMIAAHHLKKAGYVPKIFHDACKILKPLFQEDDFYPHVPLDDLEKVLEKYEKVLVENDNSERAWHLFRLRDQGKLPHLSFMFPTPSKHMQERDILFDAYSPVATNIAKGCETLYRTPFSKENGLSVPKGTFRKHPKRVVIHPTSNDPKRNWSKDKFLQLAEKLRKAGYSPVFCVGPHEREGWEAPEFKDLSEVAQFIYESGFFIGNDSGLGHLASNLGIKTLTISGNPKRVARWRPDWSEGRVVTLPFPLPNFKGIHFAMRDNHWQKFISVSSVLKQFNEMAS